MRYLFKTILILLCSYNLGAQVNATDSLFTLPDSANALTLESFYKIILQYHPIARQSHLLPELAQQEIRLARGNFDPKLSVDLLTKEYQGKTYYTQFESAIKFPTIFPINPSVGVERNKGDYLNPENYISDQYNNKQLYAGISVPLGYGLLTDERRTALKQAQLFADLMEAEQVSMINKLLLEAAKEYWLWFYSYYNYKLTVTNTQIAENIFRRILINYQLGEAAVMDTIQAKIIWIERQTAQQELMVQLQNQRIAVSSYLWDSLLNPVDLPLNFAPVLKSSELAADLATLEKLYDQAKQNHPDLLKMNVKIGQLENERKLAREFLKPKLNLNYYLLNQPLTFDGTTSFSPNDNYKFGLDFSIPILLRKERSKLSQTKIKLSQANLELDLKRRLILNNITANFNQIVASQTIVVQQTENISNYKRIIEMELTNLENGESDLFKLNIQLEKLFNSQAKLLKTVSNLEKQKVELYWAAGNVVNQAP